MTFEFWLQGIPQIPILPFQLPILLFFALLLAIASIQSLPDARNLGRAQRGLWLVLAILAAGLAGVAVVRIPVAGLPTLPGIPLTPPGPLAGLVAVVPIALGAGFLGPLPAITLGLIVGGERAVLDTHQALTLLEYSLVAWSVAWFLRQDYAGRFFAFLRLPIGACLGSVPFALVLRLLTDYGYARGDLVVSTDFVLSRLPGHMLTVVIEFAAGGLIAQGLRLLLGRYWPVPSRIRPAWFQRSLVWHLSLWLTLPLALMAVLILAATITQSRVQAEDALLEQVRLASQGAGSALSVSLMTGQTLLQQMGNDVLRLQGSPDVLQSYLSDRLQQPAYFQQLAYLTNSNHVVAVYPSLPDPLCGELGENQGCQQALKGAAWLGWTDMQGSDNPWLSMIQPVLGSQGQVLGFLIGRTSLEINPLLSPVRASFQWISGSQGLLLDAQGNVLYPAQAEPWIEQNAVGHDEQGGSWYLDTTSDGRRRLSYLSPMSYPNWEVAIRVPEENAFRVSLGVGTRVGLLILLVTVMTQLLVMLIAQRITQPLRGLVRAAEGIAAGDLDRRVEVQGEDEFGVLGRAFETMQHNLKRQARDQDLLLRASQAVASQLDLQEACRAILQGALAASGAGGARVVLVSSPASASGYREFSQGDLAEKMASLDEYVVSLVRERSPWAVGNLGREGNLFPSYFTAQLGALLAFRLMQSDRFYGALWLAFAQPQVFDQSTLDLLAGLASQAAVAASNARLLEASEGGRQRLEAILSAIPDGVLMTDADGRLLFSNAAARELLGTPLPETGQVLLEHGALAGLSKVLRGSAPGGGNLEMPGADGRRLLVSVGTVPGTGSGSLGQVCLIQDVTRFKQLEDLKSEFVHTVSHDLRRPLTQIGGLANMLEVLGPVNSAQQEYIGRIRAAVQNTTRLVEDLLDLSRIERGVEAKREAVEIRELVVRVVEDFRSEAGSRGVQVAVSLPDQLPKIQADAALLERALGNLMDNAIRFNRAGGSVQVRAEVRDQQMLIAVQDTGSGIAPADQGRIFERFYHARNRDPSSPPGWGLGLAIVKSIADWHQGRVWVESQLGKGSTFYLSLPLLG